MIRTENDLRTAWQHWDRLARELSDAMVARVPNFGDFEPEGQGRILCDFYDDPDLSGLIADAVQAAETIEGHGKPSPLPPGDDHPILTTTEATTGLPFTLTTNAWRDMIHRQLAAEGHGYFDPDCNRFEAPRDPAAYDRMMRALKALLRPEAVR